MPFKTKKSGKKIQVVNAHTGRVLGEHDTQAEADAQLRAVYANWDSREEASEKAAGYATPARIRAKLRSLGLC